MNAVIDQKADQPRATLRDWLGLAVLALPCLLYSMDLTVLNLAVPSLSADLKPSSSELLWIIDIYGFVVAGSLITMGTLGDRIGRRRLLLIGAACFGATSVLAAFSTSPQMLIAARALLGLSGATLAPSTLSLIRNMFLDDKQRTVAISVWITSYSAGAAIGPPLGGLLLEYFAWGSVFLLGVPCMLLLLILGPILLPEFKDPDAGKLDLLSAGLSLVAILTAVYGLKQFAEHGLELRPVLFMLTGLGVASIFVYRQLHLTKPLIDMQLFKVPQFSASLATYMLGGLTMFGAFIFIAQYLQLVLDLSPLEAGLWTMPWACGFIVGSMLTPMIAQRFKAWKIMVIGLIVGSIGFAMLTQLDANSGLMMLVSSTVIISLGMAPVFTLTTDMIIGAAPPERAGAAAAISETSAELGGAMGIAVLGSIGTAIYRSEMTSGVPDGVSPQSAEAARSTLGGAVSVAEGLPADLSAQLLDSARTAFEQSMELTAIFSSLAMLLIAAMVIIVLRDVDTGTGAESDESMGFGNGLTSQPAEAD